MEVALFQGPGNEASVEGEYSFSLCLHTGKVFKEELPRKMPAPSERYGN